MIGFFTDWIKNALALAGAFFSGRLYEKKERAEDDAKAIKKQAQKWADASGESPSDRLRRLAKRKY